MDNLTTTGFVDSMNTIIDFQIYKADNNIDKVDNLDKLPPVMAVYGIFGRINGKPANCRFTGETDNLCLAIKSHFSKHESNPCLKQFMQSIKVKTINYQLMPGSSKEERVELLKRWNEQYNPDCSEELNAVY